MFPFGSPSPPPCVSNFLGLRAFSPRSLGPLLAPATAVFIVAPLARLIVFKMVLEPLSAAAVGANALKDRKKFQEAAWRATLYAVACSFAAKAMLFPPVSWLEDSTLFWKGWPEQELTSDMRLIYALYMGLYVHQLVFLFTDTRSSDFAALVLHHCITLFLVFCSWLTDFTRIGSFIMVLHDCSDIFLEVAKCFNYSQKKHPAFSTGADVAFVVFAVTFFYLRLYIYPTRAVYSAAVQACEHVTCVDAPFPLSECATTKAFWLFLPALAALQGLQVFWGWKIIGVITTVLRGKPLEDPRDDKDD